MNPKQHKTFKLRNQSIQELQKTLEDLRKELSDLRVAKVSSAVASKLSKIKVVRKTIARYLTVINEKRRTELKNSFSTRAGIREYNEKHGTTFSKSKLPKELRPKLTRALRKKITKRQQNRLLPKQIKKRNAFPQRRFALKAQF